MSTNFIPSAAEAVVIRSGDKLLLRYDSNFPLTAQMAQTIKDRVSEALGGGVQPGDVLVLNCDQIAVFRDE